MRMSFCVNHHTAIAYENPAGLFRQEFSLYTFYFSVNPKTFYSSVQAQNSRSCSGLKWGVLFVTNHSGNKLVEKMDVWVFFFYMRMIIRNIL